MSQISNKVPSYLIFLLEQRGVVCSDHGTSYVQSTPGQHLLDKHQVKLERREEILAYFKAQKSATLLQDIIRPVDGSQPLPGLPILNGFGCTVDNESCRSLSPSKAVIRRHCRVKHKIRALAVGRPERNNWNEDQASGYRQVRIQTLSSKKSEGLLEHSNIEKADSIHGRTSWLPDMTSSVADERLRQYRQTLRDIQKEEQKPRIGDSQHVSELTNWLKETSFHAYLAGLDDTDFPEASGLPDPDEEPIFAAICDSIIRNLRKSMEILDFADPEMRKLSRLNATLLNTFRRSEMSHDPIKSLQDIQSSPTYTKQLQQLVCYFSRVREGNYLRQKTMFNTIIGQISAWGEVQTAAKVVAQANSRIENASSMIKHLLWEYR